MGDRNSRPFTISSKSAGATPDLRTRAKASPLASIAAASRKVPASLITFARPGAAPPTITPPPLAASRGRRRSGGAIGDGRVERLERVGTAARAIVDDDCVARLQQEPSDRQTHAAETDESDFHDSPRAVVWQAVVSQCRHLTLQAWTSL